MDQTGIYGSQRECGMHSLLRYGRRSVLTGFVNEKVSSSVLFKNFKPNCRVWVAALRQLGFFDKAVADHVEWGESMSSSANFGSRLTFSILSKVPKSSQPNCFLINKNPIFYSSKNLLE
jgi:hypothetical protein